MISSRLKIKIEVRYKYVSQSVKESLAALTMIETLSDADVKQAFSKVTEWKREILKIKDSKMKFDKDIVGVDIDPT